VFGYIGVSTSDAAMPEREGATAVFDDMSRLPALLRAQAKQE
jgi:hypothetical protein